MEFRQYIKTILPLKLEWEPWYYATCNITPGTRVKVKFAGREYIAVVSALSDAPDMEPGRIQPITGLAEGLEAISEKELRLWRFIADYYLCTVGEVYKAAYPAGKQAVEARKPRSRKDMEISETGILPEIEFERSKPVLVVGNGRESIYRSLAGKTISQGKDVLILRPGAAAMSYTEMRDTASAVRRTDSPAQIITGRKQLLFLPFSKLGLIIVDEEQDSSYKQESPAPRYNARDVAVMLAGIHDARVVLGSSCPSLESQLNVRSGKFSLIRSSSVTDICECAGIIDTDAEKRKRGMKGSFSIKLIEAMSQALERKEHILLLLPWSDTRDTEIEARSLFPQARTRLKVSSLSRAGSFDKYGLIALLNADFLFTRQDFRSDEKALQRLSTLASGCSCPLIIQGAEISARLENLNADRLLAERQEFALPPFSRMVAITINDNNEARKAKMTSILTKRLGAMQIFLPKDRNLATAKKRIAATVAAIESEFSYPGHIHIDVDPL